MVIDSSALLAILLDEPDAEFYIAAILSDGKRLISAATLVETSIVIFNKRQPTQTQRSTRCWRVSTSASSPLMRVRRCLRAKPPYWLERAGTKQG